jgi:hypothetical protein
VNHRRLFTRLVLTTGRVGIAGTHTNEAGRTGAIKHSLVVPSLMVSVWAANLKIRALLRTSGIRIKSGIC